MTINNCIILFVIIFVLILLYINIGKAIFYKYYWNLKVQNIFSYIFVFNEIFLNKDYKYLDSINFKKLNKNKKEIYFDVGGNNGLYSLYLNNKNKNIEVHVFEPIEDLYKNIKWNIKHNKKLSNTYFINNFGLGNKNEKLQINYMPNADGLSTIKNDIEVKKNHIVNGYCHDYNYPIINFICKSFMSQLLNKNRLKVEKRNIKLVRFSDYVKEHKIDFIDKIKVDIEGYELEFLEGINKEDFAKIGAFVIEVENYRSNHTKNILDILQLNNFSYKLSEDKNNKRNNWLMIYAKNNLYK
jgi:FkbM family methyltransferase